MLLVIYGITIFTSIYKLMLVLTMQPCSHSAVVALQVTWSTIHEAKGAAFTVCFVIGMDQHAWHHETGSPEEQVILQK